MVAALVLCASALVLRPPHFEGYALVMAAMIFAQGPSSWRSVPSQRGWGGAAVRFGNIPGGSDVRQTDRLTRIGVCDPPAGDVIPLS